MCRAGEGIRPKKQIAAKKYEMTEISAEDKLICKLWMENQHTGDEMHKKSMKFS